MDTEISILARRVASRVAGELDPELTAAVERELTAAESRTVVAAHRGLTFDAGTSIALAGFLLAAVQFGWTVWRDLKKDREEARQRAEEALATPARELLLRRLRLGVEPPAGLAAGRRDRLLEAVADEILGEADSRS